MSLYIKTEQGWRPLVISFAPCSNSNDLQGVFRPENRDDLPRKMEGRIARFLKANAIGNMMEKQHFFRGDSFDEPIYGAFGEKL
jgi:hypothetical protein